MSNEAGTDLSGAFRALEEKAGGRLGAYVLDTQTGLGSGWRIDERFAHCSSFKLSLAAMFLSRAERGDVDLGEVLRWSEADIMPNSDYSRKHVGKGATIEDLSRATLVYSDNTAANVLLRRAGGPQQLTGFWRSLGDEVSRLDRLEPQLNETPAGSEMDTTTPAAMAATVAKMVHGNALGQQARETLRGWMIEVETGARRIRAGLPKDWIAGDKTGTGMGEKRHTYVDLAFAGPKGRAPLIIASYYEPVLPKDTESMNPAAEAVLAEVGRIAAASLAAPSVALLGGLEVV
ncbi:MAG TPA: class A beta-lactamase [Sphingomonadaceae bacterium]|nr:class A beta-lactamase [Sphingomonadaceae bacterium]